MRGVVPTGMKWNAVEWWNTAVHAPAFLLSPLPPSLFDSPPPLLSFFLFFPPSPLPLFNGAPHFSPFSVSPPFSLASYVRNEPQLIHHNRFTCTSAAATFTCLLPLSPMSLAFGPIRSSLLGSVGNIGCFHTAVRWNKDHRKCRISLRDFVQLSLRINLILTNYSHNLLRKRRPINNSSISPRHVESSLQPYSLTSTSRNSRNE